MADDWAFDNLSRALSDAETAADSVRETVAKERARAEAAEARVKELGERERGLARPFDAADAKDWQHLDALLGQSAHGKFWREVFAEVRAKSLRKSARISKGVQSIDRAPSEDATQ